MVKISKFSLKLSIFWIGCVCVKDIYLPEEQVSIMLCSALNISGQIDIQIVKLFAP